MIDMCPHSSERLKPSFHLFFYFSICVNYPETECFIFRFGEISLIIPSNGSTGNAIADGELKKIKMEIVDFSNKFVIEAKKKNP